jgi:hypothetical protein
MLNPAPATGKPSFESQLAEDTSYKKAATDTFLTKSNEIAQPYIDLLDQYVKQGNLGQGLFEPISYGFGGKKMGSIVPKSNRALADQLVGYSGQEAKARTALAEDTKNAALEYTPNKASTDYTKMLLGISPGLVMNSTATTNSTGEQTTEGNAVTELLGLALGTSSIIKAFK